VSSPSSLVTATSRILGPTVAAVLEICFFHPVDTIVKRLMTHHGPVVPRGASPAALAAHLSGIIFTGAATAPGAPASVRARSLYPGLGYAVSYKIAQRVYKFGGQPFARDLMRESRLARALRARLSEKNARVALDGLAGCLVGLGEVMLLPLDVLKIKAQTNPGALGGRSFVDLVLKERGTLYSGATWTAARNLPGSLALFAGSAAVREHVFDAHGRPPTLAETFVSSAAGSVLSIMTSSPMDVIKTRVQNADFGRRVSGSQVVRDIIRTEGVTAFARGIVPKVLTVGPKLVFSFTVAQYTTAHIAHALGAPTPAGHKGGH
jgi:hypothetical protein